MKALKGLIWLGKGRKRPIAVCRAQGSRGAKVCAEENGGVCTVCTKLDVKAL